MPKKEAKKYALLQRDLGFILASTTSIEEALVKVLEYILKIKEITAAGIYLINPATGNLELMISSGLSADFIEMSKQYSPQDKHYKIVQKGVPIYKKYSDLFEGSNKFQKENLDYIGVVPIKYANRVIGSINIGSRFSQQNNIWVKTYIETISAQVGGAFYRINTQENLLRHKKNFKLVFEPIDDFIFIVDAKGKIITTNPVVEKRLGYTAEELQGMSILNIYPPEKREEAVRIGEKIVAGKLNVYTFPLYTKTGEQIPAETRIAQGEWDRNRVFYGITRDISERIKASEELRTSEACWQFALDSFGDGMWEYNIQTGKIYYSNNCLRISGYNQNDVTGTVEEWKSSIHREDKERVLQNMKAHLNGESAIFESDFRVLCKDGNYKWIMDRGKVIRRSKNGAPERMIGISIDISKQKKLENSLMETLRKEKELNEIKSQFVSLASHEFRTPLATMITTIDTLAAYWERMSKNDINQKIERIKNNIQFLTNIIDKTLNLTHLESGKLKIVPVETELNEFLKEIIEGIKLSPGTKHKLFFYGIKIPLRLKIDKQMLKEVIINLLNNSMKYSDPDNPVKIKLIDKAKQIEIHVSDKGIGIPETDKQNIFNAFQRGSNVTVIHGTGLGLTLSMKFIRLQGGDITFKSKINEGTTFFVTLPKT